MAKNGQDAKHGQDETLLRLLHETVIGSVRAEVPDLTSRQLAVYLTVYLTDEPQTVRGLAGLLNISKPAISRAIDRLMALKLVDRKEDPADKRSIHVARTKKGREFLETYHQHVRKAAKAVGYKPPAMPVASATDPSPATDARPR